MFNIYSNQIVNGNKHWVLISNTQKRQFWVFFGSKTWLTLWKWFHMWSNMVDSESLYFFNAVNRKWAPVSGKPHSFFILCSAINKWFANFINIHGIFSNALSWQFIKHKIKKKKWNVKQKPVKCCLDFVKLENNIKALTKFNMNCKIKGLDAKAVHLRLSIPMAPFWSKGNFAHHFISSGFQKSFYIVGDGPKVRTSNPRNRCRWSQSLVYWDKNGHFAIL